MTESAPVRFSRSAADEEAVPPQSATQAAEDVLVDPVLWGALSTDRRVADLVGHGWCLYPPVGATLDPAGDPRVSPSEATDYITVHEDRSSPDLLAVTLDTLWTIEVDESCPVLVLPWTGRFDDRVAPQLVTADDGEVRLDVPIVTTESVTIDGEGPIVQLVPVPEALLDAPSEAGVPPEGTLDWL